MNAASPPPDELAGYPLATVPPRCDAVDLGSRAMRALSQLEVALDRLAACEPRGSELAMAVSLAAARLDRHHQRPHQALVEEYLAA